MDLEEVKERYKMLPLYGRMLLVCVIGVLPGAWIYLEDGSVLEERLAQARDEEDAARRRFEDARNKKGNLPQLEQQLHETEEQLEKAKKALPDSFQVETILEKVATIARETGVELSAFTPNKTPICGDGEFRYMELPIEGEIFGKYNQAAMFFDRVAHLDGTVFLKSMVLERELEGTVEEQMRRIDAEADKNHEQAKIARSSLRVRSKFQMAVYKSMLDGEDARCGAGSFDDDGTTLEQPVDENKPTEESAPSAKAKTKAGRRRA